MKAIFNLPRKLFGSIEEKIESLRKSVCTIAQDLEVVTSNIDTDNLSSNLLGKMEAYDSKVDLIKKGLNETNQIINNKVLSEDGQIMSQIKQLSDEISLSITAEQAKALIDVGIGNISLVVSSADGTSTFKLESEGTTISTETLNITCDVANVNGLLNVNGKIKSDLIEAQVVEAENIVGTTLSVPIILATSGVWAGSLVGDSVGIANSNSFSASASSVTIDGKSVGWINLKDLIPEISGDVWVLAGA